MIHLRLGNRVAIVVLLLLSTRIGAQESEAEATLVPLLIGGDYLGEIAVRFTAEDTPLVRTSALLNSLRDYLTDSIVENVETVYAQPAWAPLDDLSNLGFLVEFDWEELAVVVGIPPASQRPERISLRGVSRAPRGTPVEPARFSLIANLDLWARYRYEAAQLDLSATPDLAFNVLGSVVELKGGLRTTAPIAFLDHARFTLDFLSLSYRLEAGDLTFSNTRLTGLGGITGVSFSRHPPLLPSQDPGSGFVQAVTLDSDSDVAIYLNESRVRSETLEAGNYEFFSFPIVQGLNTIVVEWTDSEGVRAVELVVPADPALLAAGEFDSGVVFGVADRDIRRPVLAAYQSLGITDTLTIGLREGVEFLGTQFDVGFMAGFATLGGTLRFEPDVLVGPAGRVVVDIPVSYRFLDSRPSSYRSIGVTGGYSFARADSAAEPVSTGYGSAFINLAFADGFSLTPRVFYSYAPAGRGHLLQLRAGLRKSIRGGSSLNADVGFLYDQGPQFTATVSYSASFPERRQNLFLQQDLDAQKFTGYWSRYAGDEAEDIDLNLSGSIPVSFDEQMTVSGQIGFINPFLRMSANHGFTGVVNAGEYANATSARVQSSVVAAGGSVGLTTPVSDSFVLVVPGESTAAIPLRVNRSASSTAMDLLGEVGVIPGVTSHSVSEIWVEPLEVVPGADERDLQYHVIPAYRSGTVIRVDVEQRVYVGGLLLDSREAVLDYALGTWSRVGTDESGEFFTDANGYFEIYNLLPGSYSLSLPQRPDLFFLFEVPAGSSEFLDLQDVVGAAE